MALFCWLLASLISDDLQNWVDSTGSYRVQARLLIDKDEALTADARLQKADGSIVTVPLARLSEASRRRVRKLRQAGPSSNGSRSLRDSEARQTPEREEGSQVWNWRGPNRDGISAETGLLDDWSTESPRLLWSADGLGSGMSSVAVDQQHIYTLGNKDGGEHLIAIDRTTGTAVWNALIGRGGDSNSTPTIDEDRVYGLGRAGDLACVNIADGKLIWKRSFANDFGGKMMSEWGYSESVLIDGDKLICTPGGPNAAIVALDKLTGKTIWTTPLPYGGNTGQDGAGYSSIVISQAAGTKQYVTLTGRGLLSVNAATGQPLWMYPKIANRTANIPTPIVQGDFVLCSSGYDDGGTALLKIGGRGNRLRFQEVYYFRAHELQNHHGGMIKIGDKVFLGEGHNQGFPMCFDFMSGRKLWPKQRGAGRRSASIVSADGHLYFRYEDGTMALVEANPREYKLKGTFRIASVHRESWPHPVIFDGKLLLRDQHQLHCYDIRKPQH